jgi:hypothetical protein
MLQEGFSVREMVEEESIKIGFRFTYFNCNICSSSDEEDANDLIVSSSAHSHDVTSDEKHQRSDAGGQDNGEREAKVETAGDDDVTVDEVDVDQPAKDGDVGKSDSDSGKEDSRIEEGDNAIIIFTNKWAK